MNASHWRSKTNDPYGGHAQRMCFVVKSLSNNEHGRFPLSPSPKNL
ncbi:hypothetical protein [Rubritalea tangerina]